MLLLHAPESNVSSLLINLKNIRYVGGVPLPGNVSSIGVGVWYGDHWGSLIGADLLGYLHARTGQITLWNGLTASVLVLAFLFFVGVRTGSTLLLWWLLLAATPSGHVNRVLIINYIRCNSTVIISFAVPRHSRPLMRRSLNLGFFLQAWLPWLQAGWVRDSVPFK